MKTDLDRETAESLFYYMKPEDRFDFWADARLLGRQFRKPVMAELSSMVNEWVCEQVSR